MSFPFEVSMLSLLQNLHAFSDMGTIGNEIQGHIKKLLNTHQKVKKKKNLKLIEK